MPWKCTICSRTYKRRNATKREILNAWWKHMRKYHPVKYREKKRAAVAKARRTRAKRR